MRQSTRFLLCHTTTTTIKPQVPFTTRTRTRTSITFASIFLVVLMVLACGCIPRVDAQIFQVEIPHVEPSEAHVQHCRDDGLCGANTSTEQQAMPLILAWLPQFWQRGQRVFDWLTNVVLHDLDRPIELRHELDLSRSTRSELERSIIVSFSPLASDAIVRANIGGTFGVYHMADEYCHHSVDWYKDVRFVMRNYYCPTVLQRFPDKVLWLPIGWHGFASSIDARHRMLASQRRYLFSFIGSMDDERPDRTRMIEALSRAGIWQQESRVPQYTKLISKFYGPDMIDPTTYSVITRSSALVLCPFGNNPETHRFYEALAASSIPISRTCHTTYVHTHTHTYSHWFSDTNEGRLCRQGRLYQRGPRKGLPDTDVRVVGARSGIDSRAPERSSALGSITTRRGAMVVVVS